VRRLREGEGAHLRELRLRALREAPYAFSSSFEREAQDPAETWDDLAAESERADVSVVFIAIESGEWFGMAGGYLKRSQRAAGLWGMWVAPEARRRGAGRRLVEAVADWARDRGANRLDLSVTDRAAAASSLYQRLGFAPTGEQRPLPSDASVAEIYMSRDL
jgi:GNAT superfamily N-acetyltransferase